MPNTPSSAVADPACQQNWELANELLSRFHVSVGTPEGNIAAPVGHFCIRLDGGAGTTLYVKESGPDLPTGWVGK